MLAAVVMCAVTLLRSDWDIFLLRYLYPVLPALGVGVAAAAHRRFGGRPVAVALAVQTVAAGFLWLDMAGAYYFTDLGRRLGI